MLVFFQLLGAHLSVFCWWLNAHFDCRVDATAAVAVVVAVDYARRRSGFGRPVGAAMGGGAPMRCKCLVLLGHGPCSGSHARYGSAGLPARDGSWHGRSSFSWMYSLLWLGCGCLCMPLLTCTPGEWLGLLATVVPTAFVLILTRLLTRWCLPYLAVNVGTARLSGRSLCLRRWRDDARACSAHALLLAAVHVILYLLVLYCGAA